MTLATSHPYLAGSFNHAQLQRPPYQAPFPTLVKHQLQPLHPASCFYLFMQPLASVVVVRALGPMRCPPG